MIGAEGDDRDDDRRSRRLRGHRPAIRRPVLGIFRVHGLALIRRFLLAERDLRTFPPCLPKFVARKVLAGAALDAQALMNAKSGEAQT